MEFHDHDHDHDHGWTKLPITSVVPSTIKRYKNIFILKKLNKNIN
jgi:hypothetical protein